MIIQTLKFKKGTVNIHDDYIPKTIEDKRRTLKSIYDMSNILYRNLKQRGIDISDCFYTNEELEKIKENSNYIFI